MSDKEDSTIMFTKKTKTRKITKSKTRKNNVLKSLENNQVLDLLLKKSTCKSTCTIELKNGIKSSINTFKEEGVSTDEESLQQDSSDLEDQEKSVVQKSLKQLKKIPVDWSLKKEWNIVSSKSFDWCTSKSSKEECEALFGFTKSTLIDSGNFKECFDKALLYWAYPNGSRAPSHVALISKIIGKAENNGGLRDNESPDWEYFKESVQEWYNCIF